MYKTNQIFTFVFLKLMSKEFTLEEEESENVMDRWILSFSNSLLTFVRKEMNEYRLYAVVTPLTKFFDTLTNCYIRLNRKRMKVSSLELFSVMCVRVQKF